MIGILNRREGVRFEETLFADVTEIECNLEKTLSFRCYCNEVYQEASLFLTTITNSPPPSAEGEEEVMRKREFFMMLVRGCLLVALIYETRVQRFIMAHHLFHYEIMHCLPTMRDKADAFMHQAKLAVDDFLQRRINLATMTEYCVSLWSEEYMFLNNIPRIGHPQILSTSEHTDFFPSLQSEDLGF